MVRRTHRLHGRRPTGAASDCYSAGKVVCCSLRIDDAQSGGAYDADERSSSSTSACHSMLCGAGYERAILVLEG